MRRATALLLIAVGLAGPALAQDAPAEDSAPAPPQPLRVMSFNIRYATHKDGLDAWPFRQDVVPSVIRQHRPDVCGLQEVLGGQMGSLHERLPGYGSVATGRDGRAGGERCAMFWREDRLERLEWATFWLSPTPERPSAAWGARLRRIVTWAKFRDRTDDTELFVFNTHFDHQARTAREQSAKLVLAKIAEIAGDAPVVLLGDLNTPPDSKPYTTLVTGDGDRARALRDAFDHAEHGHHGPSGTFTGFGKSLNVGPRIDYVFVGGDVHVLDHFIPSGTRLEGRTPSDHRPVVADVLLGVAPRTERVSLHSRWRFAPDPERVGRKRKWYSERFDHAEWQPIEVGEAWERQGHADHDGLGWYRRRVVVPAGWEARAALGEKIRFVAYGIDDTATIWVNGELAAKVGKRGETWWDRTAAVHLSPSLFRFGQENTLAIEVADGRVWGGLVGRPVLLTVEPGFVSHVGEGLRQIELVAPTGFHVHSEETRRLEWELRVPTSIEGPAWLVWAVGDGGDDTGDHGLHAHLVDAAGEVAESHFVRASRDVWFERVVAPGSRWTLVIEDRDTHLGGKHPGNGGRVRAHVIVQPRR